MELPLLVRVRSRQDITQDELAEKTGLSRGAISKIETGVRGANMRTAFKLADALGVELEDLTGGNTSPKAQAAPSQERAAQPEIFDEPAEGVVPSGGWQAVRALPGPEYAFLTRNSRMPDEQYGRLIDGATPDELRKLAGELGQEAGIFALLLRALPYNAAELDEVRRLHPIATERFDQLMQRAIQGEARRMAQEKEIA